MLAHEFLMYCVGSSVSSLSLAASIRILLGTPTVQKKKPRTLEPVPNPPRWEPIIEPVPPTEEQLASRLRSLQAARYASPVRHPDQQRMAATSPDPGTRRTVPVRTLPIVKAPPRRSEPPSDDNVFPLPLKMKKNVEPPKEGA